MAVCRHWTLYQMEILIHFHVSPSPFPRWDAPAFRETVDDLFANGLIEPRGEPRCYDTTARGKALIRMWQETPLPEAKFVDPRFFIEESA